MNHHTTAFGGAKRIAIVGTAPSWNLTPWHDPTLAIYSLNDAYRIKGFQRADFWADIHPLDKYHFIPSVPDGQPPPAIFAHQIPSDHYVRPAGHLDWLATQTMPVYLHPDHATQLPASATWPQARPFPKAAIEAHFGRYFTSTPGWMLAQAVLEGAREIHIYGIHLSTEQEYFDQRPNFEFLIGCVLGRGKRRLSVKDGLRRYETNDGVIVLPEASPVLSATFQYAFEPAPRKKLEPLKWEVHKAQCKVQRVMTALRSSAWGLATIQDPQPDGTMKPRRARVSTLQQELIAYEALLGDCQDILRRAHQEL